MPILRQSYANPIAASESDLVRVRVRVGVRVRVWARVRVRVRVRMRVSGQGQGSGWHAFESRRPLGGLLGRLLPQRVGEHAQRLELARRRRLGGSKAGGIGEVGRGAGMPRIRAVRPPPLLRPSLSSGPLSPLAPPLGAQEAAQGLQSVRGRMGGCERGHFDHPCGGASDESPARGLSSLHAHCGVPVWLQSS